MRVMHIFHACGLLFLLAAAAAVAREEVPSAAGGCKDDECGVQEQSTVALMQLKSAVKKGVSNVDLINAAPTAAERAALLQPVAWMHPMKCGSSLFNVLVGLDSLWEDCPADVKIDPATAKGETTDTLSAVLALCPGVFGEIPASCTDAQCWWGGHMSLATIWEPNKGHFVAMLRQPEQMLLSGHNELHAWFEDQEPKNALEYAKIMQGCQTKMLARESPLSPCRSDAPEPPTAAELALALDRLLKGFAWVGITDDWDMSICAFHAKFGGSCLASDFANVNPGQNTTVSLYDTSVLEGWTDKSDNVVFAAAQGMLRTDMERYGVTTAFCEKACW